MRISWNPNPAISGIQFPKIQTQQAETQVTQYQLTEVPEEAKKLFKGLVGQRLQGEHQRFSIQNTHNRKDKRTLQQLEAWAVLLFEDSDQEESNDSRSKCKNNQH